MVGVATPPKRPSSVIAKQSGSAIALLTATAVRTQAAATAHISRDGRFCFADFPAKIMTLSFRGQIASTLRSGGRSCTAGRSGANYSPAVAAGNLLNAN